MIPSEVIRQQLETSGNIACYILLESIFFSDLKKKKKKKL